MMREVLFCLSSSCSCVSRAVICIVCVDLILIFVFCMDKLGFQLEDVVRESVHIVRTSDMLDHHSSFIISVAIVVAGSSRWHLEGNENGDLILAALFAVLLLIVVRNLAQSCHTIQPLFPAKLWLLLPYIWPKSIATASVASVAKITRHFFSCSVFLQNLRNGQLVSYPSQIVCTRSASYTFVAISKAILMLHYTTLNKRFCQPNAPLLSAAHQSPSDTRIYAHTNNVNCDSPAQLSL